MKTTTAKKCPHCSSVHVHDANAVGFSKSQYWYPNEEKSGNSNHPMYNCRNCGLRFYCLAA